MTDDVRFCKKCVTVELRRVALTKPAKLRSGPLEGEMIDEYLECPVCRRRFLDMKKRKES